MTAFEDGYHFFERNCGCDCGVFVGDRYVSKIEKSVDKMVNDLNQFSGYRTKVDYLKGDIAEFYHSGTHNVNVALKDTNIETKVIRSHGLGSADIVYQDGTDNIIKASLKYFGTGEASAKAQSISVFERYCIYRSKHDDVTFEEYLRMNGINSDEVLAHDSLYSGQIRIIPAEQIHEAIEFLQRKISEEQYKRPELVDKYSETLQLLRDRIRDSDGVESVPLSEDDARKLARLAKQGNVSAEELHLTLEEIMQKRYIIEQAIKAGMSAAVITTAFKVAPVLYEIVCRLKNSGNVDEEQFRKLGIKAFYGAGEGFIRGSVAAAITISCRSGILGKAVKSLTPAVIGVFTAVMLDALQDAIMVVKGDITRREMSNHIFSNIFISSVSLALGGITQIVLPIPVISCLLGSFIGSVVGAFVFGKVEKTYISYCAETGYTMFGVVNQDYVLPDDVLKDVGLEMIKVEKFEFEKFVPEYFSFSDFNSDAIKIESIGMKLLRRGVIGVSKIGYVNC